MNTHVASIDNHTRADPSRMRDWPKEAQRVARLLSKLRHGSLTVQWPDGQVQAFGDPQGNIHASLHLLNWQPLTQALQSGDIGFAEGYMAGDWRSADVLALLRLLIRNRRELEDVVYGHWIGRLFYRVRHWLNRNTRQNSAKNIHAHYDLGNAFYALWLDPTMNYSSAWFDGDHSRSL
ncbi:MAG: Cyclopropane-fatty-acyl-phospholipid synthase, partial [Pseudomonadota bacterium]